jgi:hypothetical protein
VICWGSLAIGFVLGVVATFGLAEIVGSFYVRRDETEYVRPKKEMLP